MKSSLVRILSAVGAIIALSTLAFGITPSSASGYDVDICGWEDSGSKVLVLAEGGVGCGNLDVYVTSNKRVTLSKWKNCNDSDKTAGICDNLEGQIGQEGGDTIHKASADDPCLYDHAGLVVYGDCVRAS